MSNAASMPASAPKTLFEECLVDGIFFAVLVSWGFLFSGSVSWVASATHVFCSVLACVALFLGGSGKRKMVAVCVGFSCSSTACVDALFVAQLATRLWLSGDAPTFFARGVDTSDDLSVVAWVGAHLLSLGCAVYRARRAGSELGVDSSFVSLGAGLGGSVAYLAWIFFGLSLSKSLFHGAWIVAFFFVLGSLSDLVVTGAPNCALARWCNAFYGAHAFGFVAQYVILLANVAYLFDEDVPLFSSIGLTHGYRSVSGRAQGVALLTAVACANAHRNSNVLSVLSTSEQKRRTLSRLAEIEPIVATVVAVNDTIARVIPFVIGIAIVFARDAAGISRFGILAYATFVWLRGRAQTTLAGWRWEIGVSIAGAAIGVCVGVWLLFFSSSGWLDANQKRVVGAAVFVDAGVALATTACAGWAAHDENLDKRKKC
jgi:hypothetical protein